MPAYKSTPLQRRRMTGPATLASLAGACICALVAGTGAFQVIADDGVSQVTARHTGIDIRSVTPIHTRAYADMFFMVRLTNTHVFATLTVSDKAEGGDDQHILMFDSTDGGRSWSSPRMLEPPEGPEASWAMPYFDGRRLYVFYLYNHENIRSHLLSDRKTRRARVDTLGDLAVRYSDDSGRTWSDRTIIPIPRSAIDRENPFEGSSVISWFSGAPQKIGDAVYLGLSKIGEFRPGQNGIRTEAFLLRTDNPLDAKAYSLVPGIDRGFRAADGSGAAEEPSFTVLPSGAFHVVMRGVSGQIITATELRDTAPTTWTIDVARTASGTPLLHPRAKAVIFRVAANRYALWFHNNSEPGFKRNRNPVYLACGVAVGQRIEFGPARALLFDADRDVGISYPSFLTLGDETLVAETNKKDVRIHRFKTAELCPDETPNSR